MRQIEKKYVKYDDSLSSRHTSTLALPPPSGVPDQPCSITTSPSSSARGMEVERRYLLDLVAEARSRGGGPPTAGCRSFVATPPPAPRSNVAAARRSSARDPAARARGRAAAARTSPPKTLARPLPSPVVR
ncbi:Os09g0476401 [Oryza sativa Japonica Group]|uniref:Os09g0476401 protein n=1 Tax=Oryza sativa subsp. japonica TaxID=39947 RepID=A0A0P0XP86_ORYSJ|nr:Os09g0476401 [Oryza sativa Japonica Group]